MSVLDVEIGFFQSGNKLISGAVIIFCVSCLMPSSAMAQSWISDALDNIVLVDAVDQGSRGTGFVISNDGYILTNNHVANGEGRYAIRFSGSDEFIVAQFIDSDAEVDIALLKIENFRGKALPVSIAPNLIAQEVWASGFPGAADQAGGGAVDATITKGILSRSYVGQWRRGGISLGVLQHDAATLGGNSGGPLLNECSEVIGINTGGASSNLAIDDEGITVNVGAGIYFASNIRESIPMLNRHDVNFVTVSQPCEVAQNQDQSSEIEALTQTNKKIFSLLPFLAIIATISLIFSLKKPRQKVGEIISKTGLIERRKGDVDYSISGKTADGKSFLLKPTKEMLEQGYVLGRHPDITHGVIDDPVISNRHLRFSLIEGEIYVEELNAEVPTFFKGSKLESFQSILCSGTNIIEVGDLRMQIKFD